MIDAKTVFLTVALAVPLWYIGVQMHGVKLAMQVSAETQVQALNTAYDVYIALTNEP